MAMRYLRLSSVPDSAQSERRRAERKELSASLTISAGKGESASAEINDVSSLGCNLRVDADWMRIGRFVTASMGEKFTVAAVVRWSRDGVYGIEFLRPLSGALVSELEELCG